MKSQPELYSIATEGFLSAKEVSARIVVPPDPPILILIVGPCRSGSTALFYAFARCFGGEAQPIKTILRKGAKGFVFPSKREFFVIKENFGPHHLEEACFDPIRLLLEAGYPSTRIKMIVSIREPQNCLDSWVQQGGLSICPAVYYRAWENIPAVLHSARKANIPFRIVSAESLSDNCVADTVWNLCHGLGIPFHRDMLEWTTRSREHPSCA